MFEILGQLHEEVLNLNSNDIMKVTSSLAIVLAVGASISTLSAQVFNYDFNTSEADYNSFFNSTGAGEWSTNPPFPGWVSTAGVDNTGRIASGGNNNTAVLLEASDFSTVGSTQTVSTYFEARTNGDGEINGFNALGFGFTTSSTVTLNSDQYLAADVVPGATLGTNVLNLRYRETGTINNPDSDEFSLVTGNWYQMQNVVTKEAGMGEFSFVITLTDFGPDGTSAGTVIDTYSTGVLTGMTTLWNQTELNAAFQGYSQGGAGGAFGYDNFSATIPEPTSAAMLMGALGLLALRRRK